MQISKVNKFLILVVFIIALAYIVSFFYKKTKVVETKVDNNQTSGVSTTTTIGGLQISSQGTGDYKVEQVPTNEGRNVLPQPVPGLSRPVVFSNSANLTNEAKDLINSKIVGLEAELKKDSTYVTGWIDLGMYYKIVGDYDGALMYWNYATRLAPKDYISYGNLGDLYAYYLKNNAQAEVSYKTAITNGPKQVYLYVQFASVYRDIFKDLDKARSVVDQGLKNNPEDKTLLELKANLK